MAKTTTITKAQTAVAAFLRVPSSSISCKLMPGGSVEGALVKCSHHNKAYIVKLFDEKELMRQEAAWTQFAANLGIGPKLYCQEPHNNLFIMKFVEGQSLQPTTASDPAILRKLAQKIKRLHRAAAPFGRNSELLPRIEAKYKKLKSSGKLEQLLASVWNRAVSINNIIEKTTIVPTPCHQDLNPRNVFITKDQDIIIIDWGDSSLGNPYYDIAVFFVLNALPHDKELLFLQEYNPELLSERWQHYLQDLKQLVRLEFAFNLLGGVQAQKHELLHQQELPTVLPLNHYLTQLAQYVNADADFLYSMGLAALNEFMQYNS